ncbi:MAG: FAD-dependent oxidoreductase [bacterium]|nr:FAD-dependent oxidoreductase [bacterium]
MYDVSIIGLGCAAYTAAVYTARYKLATLVVGEVEGGMGITAAEVGNWPGEVEIPGPELMENFKNHALSFDEVSHKVARVESIEKIDGGYRLKYQNGESDEAKTIIFATGSNKRHLGVPGEEELSGKGVTYCATCDAFFFKGKDVAVLGGGDSAVEGAAIAAQVANKVYLIHRRDSFRAEPYWVDKVKEKDNVVFVLERNVTEILGEGRVSGLKLDKEFEGSDTINLDGVFIEVGSTPATSLPIAMGCEVDEKGHLKVDAGMRTNVAGVFGAGDVTDASNYFAQFATAAGEGCIAANSAFTFLQSGK